MTFGDPDEQVSVLDIARYLCHEAKDDERVQMQFDDMTPGDLFAAYVDMLSYCILLGKGADSLDVNDVTQADLEYAASKMRLAKIAVHVADTQHPASNGTVVVHDASSAEGHVLHLKVKDRCIAVRFQTLIGD